MYTPPPEGTYTPGQTSIVKTVAVMSGSAAYPSIRGTVRFTQTPGGVVVMADIMGLPLTAAGFFGFHLHTGNCRPPSTAPAPGQQADYFPDAGSHYNPKNLPHPRHAGDFPPLIETSRGTAQLSFITDRFTIFEAIGKAVIIHLDPDDLSTQPSGNSGPKIACGIVAPELGPY